MNRATRQRRWSHRRRKMLARTIHQLQAIRRPWMRAWRRNEMPGRIKLPKAMWAHRVRLYRFVVQQ